MVSHCSGTLWAALQRGMYHDDNGSPKLHAILTTALEVCQGVAYMHSHRVVHRDLTSGNVLLMREPMAQRVKAKVMPLYCVPCILWHQEPSTAASPLLQRDEHSPT